VLAGRYRLERILGRGGMGTVYAAHDEALGRDVAVKVLDLTVADATAMARFTREARILASLQHPHVVAVHDFGTDASTAWLVMPLLPGPDLQTLIDQRGPQPVEAVTRYGGQAATALAAAHAAGIVHRDVKPANLTLAADGSVVLLDLGIARLADATTEAGGQGPLTKTGHILGSVPYLSPEVISGATPGPQTDVYALGAVLFALLTGRTPFPDDGTAGLAQHLRAPPPSPAALRPDTPVELERLLLRMLDKDPSARPTAADAAVTLGGLAGAEASTVRFAPVTTVLPVAGGPPTRQLSAAAPAGPPDPARTPRRRPRWPWPAAAAALALIALAAFALTRSDGPGPGAVTGASTSASTSTAASPSPPPPPVATSEASPPPTDASDPVRTALADLEAAIDDAATSGALVDKEVRDTYERLDKVVRSLQDDDSDVDKEIEEFEERVDKLEDRGDLTEEAASRVKDALDSLNDAVTEALEQND
jgi:eukaryotic-like serine/threonine-protein kinase